MKETLIDIQDLCIQFQTSAGTVHAVDHVSFDIKKEKSLRWSVSLAAVNRRQPWASCS